MAPAQGFAFRFGFHMKKASGVVSDIPTMDEEKISEGYGFNTARGPRESKDIHALLPAYLPVKW